MEFLTSQNVEVQQQIGIDVTLTFQEKNEERSIHGNTGGWGGEADLYAAETKMQGSCQAI